LTDEAAMLSWRAVAVTARRRLVLWRAPAVAVCLIVAQLHFPPPAHGAPTVNVPEVLSVPSVEADTPQARSASDSVGGVLRAAVALTEEGEFDRAGTVLSDALDRWPNHPELLAGLAGLRLRQGHPAEAEALAAHLVRIDPGSDHGWELLGASRYLQDDTHGALSAWRHRRSPVVRRMEVDVLANDGPRASDRGTDPARLTGIAEGQPLTLENLVRGERRLEALPAASRARLGYRALSGGEAAIQGTVVLGASNPFTFPDMAAHAFRMVARRIHVVSADPLGRLERWELSGALEGTLHSVTLALAHPAPRGPGVWRWSVDHEVGRYASTAGGEVVRERRDGLAWSHSDWITASVRGSAHGRIDVRPGRGTFAGAGMAWTLLPLNERSSIRAEAMGWTRVARAAYGGAGSAGRSDEAIRFGRLALGASLHPPEPAGAAGPSGVALRGGFVTVSPGVPRDLLPRFGAGGNASHLMRARSDLDGEGVVRPLFPGTSWVHGGAELLRHVGTVGPLGLGIAGFVDGVRVLGGAPASVDPAGRRGAVHLGVGMRARIVGASGWFRADWGIDPVDRASTISAAWVSGG
jgi:hypothetical protein